MYLCLALSKGITPFTTISNEELYRTNQGCKMKFTAVTEKASPNQDFIYQLNDAIDDHISIKFSTKYNEPYELTPSIESATNNLSFLHLNLPFVST